MADAFCYRLAWFRYTPLLPWFYYDYIGMERVLGD